MEETKLEMIQFPLSKLNIIGLLNSNKISFPQKLFAPVFGCLLTFCIISTFLQYFYMESDIFDFIENSEGFGGVLQILIKLGCAFYGKEKFRNLIQFSKQFWSTEKCSKSAKKKIGDIREMIVTFQKMYFYVVMIVSPSFLLTTFFGKKLPVGSWNMNNEGIFYRMVYVAYILIIPASIFFVTSFEGDMLENLSVNHIRSSEDFDVYSQQLKKSIQHHILLITFVNELQKAYSVCFMVQCFTIAPMICTEMYASSESTNVLMAIRYATICIGLIVQFAFYCVPGSFVVDEASIISNGIYNSDWFSKFFPELRMPIMFLMQVSQKELKFTACNLVEINIDTLVRVIKVGFSSNAVLKTIKA